MLLVDPLLLLAVLAAQRDVGHLGVTRDREGKEVATLVAQEPDFRAVESTQVAKVVALGDDPC